MDKAMDTLDEQTRRETARTKEREQAEAIFKLAGFEVRRVWELANGYWPLSPHYDQVRSPWWLFLTDLGLIEIGARKRVILIRWDATPMRGIVTTDDVTKEETLVHAWSVEKAVAYLKSLRVIGLRRAAAISGSPPP